MSVADCSGVRYSCKLPSSSSTCDPGFWFRHRDTACIRDVAHTQETTCQCVQCLHSYVRRPWVHDLWLYCLHHRNYSGSVHRHASQTKTDCIQVNPRLSHTSTSTREAMPLTLSQRPMGSFRPAVSLVLYCFPSSRTNMGANGLSLR